MSYITESINTSISVDIQSAGDIYAVNTSSKAIWDEIINEKCEEIDKVNSYLQTKINYAEITPENPNFQYLNEYIFPLLLPILEKTIFKAIRMECLTNQISLFNGIDFISERLWLSNPRYPERFGTNQNIFLMNWVQEWLKDHPRPTFTQSWIWTKEEAAVIIQAYMRGYFVRKTEEVQEMRQFWKTLIRERKEKELESSEKAAGDT